MDDAARVLEEIAANPDDDAPRLVWADLVGGERGELVVLQCDLARGDLPPAEVRRRRARERALLEQHAVEWAGELARVATRWSFVRGFVEAVRMPAWTPLSAWPLVRAATVEQWNPHRIEGLAQLAAFGLRTAPDANVTWPVLPGLRGLELRRLGDAGVPHALAMIEAAPIETLRLPTTSLQERSVVELLAAAPHLRALELGSTRIFDDGGGIEAAVRIPLRALELRSARTHELARLAGAPIAATLERLGFALADAGEGLADILAACPQLHTIVVAGEVAAAIRAVLDARLPALRTVRVRGTLAADLQRALSERGLAHVDLTPIDDELLHASPSALLSLGPPYVAWSQPALLVRIDRGELFEVAAVPADERVVIGRGVNAHVHVMSGTVARHHAALLWRDGAHVIQDLGGTNGILRDGQRIERAVLRDGDTLQFGEVIVRYFIGDGARARAEAALSARSRR